MLNKQKSEEIQHTITRIWYNIYKAKTENILKTHADRVGAMYRREMPGQLKLDIPFSVPLNPESRWVRLANLIPWERIEEEYIQHFKGQAGQKALPARLAFGALYIQTTEGFTDVQTRMHIQENPHMQYFCGFECYTPEPPFDASMMVHFRKRISAEMIKHITEEVFASEALSLADAPEPVDTDEAEVAQIKSANRGTLILDATCCPQDIRYPTDIGLMNQAREITEKIIDQLYKSVIDQYDYKPRTYRHVARKDYVEYSKMRKHTASVTRKHLRKQLQYTARNLRTITELVMEKGASLANLDKDLYRKLLIVQEVYRQQKEMYDTRTHRCDARIVSIAQPHVRPIVRGKTHAPTEFGTKVALGLIGGYAFITCLSWENIPEASVLADAAEQYKSMFGFYPATIIGDRAYPNQNNRNWCKQHGIRLSGPALGRKSVEKIEKESKQIYKDSCARNAVEGAFGTVKRKYGLDCIMAKLADTSHTAIAMGFFAANMERKLRLIFASDSYFVVSYDFDGLRLVILPL